MYRALGAAALAIAIAAPLQDLAAQDALGGAIIGGAAGAILGGALDGGRGAAIGAIVGGATGAAIASQGQARPGGYRYYQQACYQQRRRPHPSLTTQLEHLQSSYQAIPDFRGTK